MVEARTCYDHLAGRLGVGLYGALVDADALIPTSEVRGDVGSGRAASLGSGRRSSPTSLPISSEPVPPPTNLDAAECSPARG